MGTPNRKILILLACLAIPIFAQRDPHYLHNRSVMVHLFEWKWNDIAQECEQFLGPKGYGGVQLSPVAENVIVNNRPWWERYQPISYKFITRSGTEEELAQMIERCNKVGVRIFVDVLPNHVSASQNGPEVGTAGSTAKASERKYDAIPYSREHFHKSCGINDWNNRWEVRNCELVGLPDLDQSHPHVQEKLADMLDRLVGMGVAGFRVDAAKHMEPDHLVSIFNRLHNLNETHNFKKNARAFVTQEVSDHGYDVISREEYFPVGTVTEFKFGTFLYNVFQGGDKIKYLNNWGTAWGLMKPDDGLVFVENHDTQRGDGSLTYKNSKKYKMAVAFAMAHPHNKLLRILSGFNFDHKDQGPPQDGHGNIISPVFNKDNTCGNGWTCEHRWRQIYNMVKFRNVVHGTELTNWWDNWDQQIAFCRGNKGFIAINNWGDLRQTLQTCLPEGQYCDVISGDLKNGKCTGKTINVGNDGKAYIEIWGLEDDGVIAIHVESRVN